MLSHADEKAAMAKGEQLVEAIASDPLDWEGEKIPLKVAFGV